MVFTHFFLLVILFWNAHFFIVKFSRHFQQSMSLDTVFDHHQQVQWITIENLRDWVINFFDLIIILFHHIYSLGDFGSNVVELLQIWSLLLEFCPEIFVQTSRSDHGFFTKRDMIIKSDDFNQINSVLLPPIFFQVFPNDFLKSIDNELFFEGGLSFQGITKLLISFVLVLQFFQQKESERYPQPSAIGVLLDTQFIHPLDLQ